MELILQAQEEDRARREFLDAWNGGNGDAGEIERLARILLPRMRHSEEAARYHLEAVSEVAASALAPPTTHMILHECYRRGWAVEADAARAALHLELACKAGHEPARMFYGCYLLGDQARSSAISPEPARGMAILRELARHAEDPTSMQLARRYAALHIAKTCKLIEVSDDDRELVDWHSQDFRHLAASDYLRLARFYGGDAGPSDRARPEFRKARELLLEGAKAGGEKAEQACIAQLEQWDIAPIIAAAPPPPQPAREALKTTAAVGGIAMILIVWAGIGLFLLSVAALINAIMIPVVLIVAAAGFAFSLLRR